ncbi:MAG TPA: DUF3310 domain-containing protein [Methanofastidiosum sp.]|nr:DUF3310 domain-containing protein [Methanofastidiosum sp.]
MSYEETPSNLVQLDNGDTYFPIKPANPTQCTECCARNDALLCAKLTKVYDCGYHKVVFVPYKIGSKAADTNGSMVNQPKHYQMQIKGNRIEVRDVCEVLANRLGAKGYSGMFIADYVQLMQYLMRFDCKNGKEDLEKSMYYLNKLIENYEERT